MLFAAVAGEMGSRAELKQIVAAAAGEMSVVER